MPDGTASDGDLELEVLLADEQTFPPPPEFAAQANASDPAIYEQAEPTSRAGGRAGRAQLEWAEPWAGCSTGTRPGPSGSSTAS